MGEKEEARAEIRTLIGQRREAVDAVEDAASTFRKAVEEYWRVCDVMEGKAYAAQLDHTLLRAHLPNPPVRNQGDYVRLGKGRLRAEEEDTISRILGALME
ncbi:MAG: hypothetical protein GTO22_19600 [Gemmatimonadales bacterium]|nr:hypothetical protein [Gemmatimonadales bacterium]